jgi:hypothetical protein
MTKFSLRVHESPWGAGTELAYFSESKRGVSVAKPLEFEPLSQGSFITPTLVISTEQTQELFNELWRIGYRPKDGTGNSGHIEAINRHLDDMRRLVFKDKKP